MKENKKIRIKRKVGYEGLHNKQRKKEFKKVRKLLEEKQTKFINNELEIEIP